MSDVMVSVPDGTAVHRRDASFISLARWADERLVKFKIHMNGLLPGYCYFIEIWCGDQKLGVSQPARASADVELLHFRFDPPFYHESRILELRYKRMDDRQLIDIHNENAHE